MEKIWFKKTDNALLWKPVTKEGWIVTGTWILLILWFFRQVDVDSHSMSDSLLNTAPFFIVCTLIFLIIVRRRIDQRRWD